MTEDPKMPKPPDAAPAGKTKVVPSEKTKAAQEKAKAKAEAELEPIDRDELSEDMAEAATAYAQMRGARLTFNKARFTKSARKVERIDKILPLPARIILRGVLAGLAPLGLGADAFRVAREVDEASPASQPPQTSAPNRSPTPVRSVQVGQRMVTEPGPAAPTTEELEREWHEKQQGAS